MNKPHPILSILPPLTTDELERSTERVKLHGQSTPIETVDGLIVVGHEEYLACVAAKVKPKVTSIKMPMCITEYIIRHSVPRHLGTLDRACIAVLAFEQVSKEMGRERMRLGGRVGALRASGSKIPTPFSGERWFVTAARLVGTTAGCVRQLARLRRSAPDVFDMFRYRKLRVLRDGAELVRSPRPQGAR